MKYLKLLFLLQAILILVLLIAPSCEDFLEQPEDAITTIDSVFVNPDNAMFMLYSVYNDALSWDHGLRTKAKTVTGYLPNPNGISFGSYGNFMTYFYSDEASGELLANGTAREMLFGGWGDRAQREFPSAAVMKAIRSCNIFIENVDKVPYQVTPNWNWDETFKNQIIAEVRTLRAFLHFETFRRYGGIPILDKVATFEAKPNEGIVVTPPATRQSVKSVIDFIVSELDASLPNLKEPSGFSTSEIGRIHTGFALSLKAKALLYAASPLYNSETPPVSFSDPSLDTLICYGNYDASRWQLAVNAYKTAVIWAETNGYALLDEPSIGKRESFVYGTENPRSQSPLNKESIYYVSTHDNNLGSSFFKAGGILYQRASNGGVGGMGLNFVRNYYRDVNGAALNLPDEGTFVQYKNIMRQAEPRFHATAWVPGMQYAYTDATWWTKYGGKDTALFRYHAYQTGTIKDAKTQSASLVLEPPGLCYLKKWRQFQASKNSTNKVTWSEFTLPELYLSYIEALNEVDPNDIEILVYLNKIRVRGGLPEMTSSDPIFGDQDKMRLEIRREKAIELYGFNHRYFDVRRWKIADQVMGGDWYQIYFYENSSSPYIDPDASWTPEQRTANDALLSYKFVKTSTHVWEPKMYFYPWFYTEVAKGFLVQNPGW